LDICIRKSANRQITICSAYLLNKKMKEPKPYLLTLVSIFLVISLGLLATTIYLYFQSSSQVASVLPDKKKHSVKAISNTRDSLEKIYTATVKDLDASFTTPPVNYTGIPENKKQLNTASTKAIIDSPQSYQKLRTEISAILSDKSPAANLESAKEKISELQSMVDVLKNKNTQVTKENERLNAMLKRVNKNEAVNETESKNIKEVVAANKTQVSVSSLKAENILVSAAASSDFLEKETNKASETDKLVGSFTLKNNNSQNIVSEVIVVVLQPDGKVLQTSNWENGIFYTSAGKQIYSKKLRFNNGNGETKKLNFSLEAEKYLPGKYIIEVYHDGSVIGRATKILS